MIAQLTSDATEADWQEVLLELESRPGSDIILGFISYEARHLCEPAARNPAVRVQTPNNPVDLLRLVSVKKPQFRSRRKLNPNSPLLPPNPSTRIPIGNCGELTRSGYVEKVRQIQREIVAGEYYELNFTQRFRLRSSAPPHWVALYLRKYLSPRHWAFFDFDDFAVISASPELFLRRRIHQISTMPIKGSSPRGVNPLEDDNSARALRQSSKNAAEHTMVVDLARNDLGRICQYGSVEHVGGVRIETHPAVHHLVSTIIGQLRPQITLRDILGATFPPASVTGAPKIAVMRAIDRHEISPRGLYCGTIGLFRDDERDSFDLNVAIRTLVARPATDGMYDYEWGAGGAIVADSDPDAEYEECLMKARPLLEAILSCEQRPPVIG